MFFKPLKNEELVVDLFLIRKSLDEGAFSNFQKLILMRNKLRKPYRHLEASHAKQRISHRYRN